MLQRIFVLYILFFILIGCYPETGGPNIQEPDITEAEEESVDIAESKRVIILVGDVANNESNPLLCGLGFTLTFFEDDNDVLNDTIKVENFGENYIVSEVIDDISGTTLIKDYSCPRSVGEALDNTIDAHCHLEEHISALHFKRGQEISFLVWDCENSVYISCEICTQIQITIKAN